MTPRVLILSDSGKIEPAILIPGWDGQSRSFCLVPESDDFRLVAIKCETVVGEPRVQCSKAKLEMTETGLGRTESVQ